MKNGFIQKASNHHLAKSSIPMLSMSIKDSKSKEKKFKLKQDEHRANSQINIQEMVIPNKIQKSKIKLKQLKIVNSISTINAKIAESNPNISLKKPTQFFHLGFYAKNEVKKSNKILPCHYMSNKPKVKQITISSKNLGSILNSNKKFKLKSDPKIHDLIASSTKNKKRLPIINQSAKKGSNSVSLSLSAISKNSKKSIYSHNKRTATDPGELPHNLLIKEYSYKENPNIQERKSMEDFHHINTNLTLKKDQRVSLFAIFDGHNGANSAMFCQNNLDRILLEQINLTDYKIEESLDKTFVEIDNEIRNIPKFGESGTTATVVVFYKNMLYCANVGDSSCFIFQKDECIKMTQDHNCKDLDEVNRIKKKEGIVFNNRVFGVLNLTRVLGDIELKQYGVIPNPTINKKGITNEDKYVVIASDGVWNTLNEKKITEIIMKHNNISANNLCELIVDTSFKNHSLDNISCIVIKL